MYRSTPEPKPTVVVMKTMAAQCGGLPRQPLHGPFLEYVGVLLLLPPLVQTKQFNTTEMISESQV